MKKFILISLISLLSFSSIAKEINAIVSSKVCSFFVLASDGASISFSKSKGERMTFELNEDNVKVGGLVNYSLLGQDQQAIHVSESFKRKYKNNSYSTFNANQRRITFYQQISGFDYYYFNELCAPYDYTGLTCLGGAINPVNWLPKKATFSGQKILIELNFSTSSVFYTRKQRSGGNLKTTHQCELLLL